MARRTEIIAELKELGVQSEEELDAAIAAAETELETLVEQIRQSLEEQ